MKIVERPFVTGSLLVALMVLSSAWCGSHFAAAADPQRPNIVIVLADDLGYGDLGCYGAPVVQTPNLDRFAAESLRLTNCYAAAANCSPARAGLLTGRTPYRAGIYSAIPYGAPMHLAPREITMATLLRDAGYATCQVGKWHLNGQFNHPEQPQPTDHGFEYWFATQNNALPNHRDPDNFVRNGKPVGPLSGYAGPIVVDEAIRWLEQERDAKQRFFLYVAFHEPHEPIATEKRFTDLYPFPDDPSRAAHHGNISQMDHAFGRLLKTLDRLDLHDNTLVFFTSDNGPAITRYHPHGSTGSLREKKGHLYEGGIRVPGILRWPGQTHPGTVSDEPVSGVDWLPTICEVIGIPLPTDRAIDGASLLPILRDQPIRRTTPLYWQFNWSHSEPKVAMRMGDWKLLARLDRGTWNRRGQIDADEVTDLKQAELTGFELYNLREDRGETMELSTQQPARLAEMTTILQKLYREVRDECTVWPAWNEPSYEAARIKWPNYASPPKRPTSNPKESNP